MNIHNVQFLIHRGRFCFCIGCGFYCSQYFYCFLLKNHFTPYFDCEKFSGIANKFHKIETYIFLFRNQITENKNQNFFSSSTERLRNNTKQQRVKKFLNTAIFLVILFVRFLQGWHEARECCVLMKTSYDHIYFTLFPHIYIFFVCPRTHWRAWSHSNVCHTPIVTELFAIERICLH